MIITMPLEHDQDNQHIEISIEKELLVFRIWPKGEALPRRVVLGGVEYSHLKHAVEFLEELYA